MKGGTYFGEAVIQAPVARQTHAFVARGSAKTPMAATHIVLDGALPELRTLPRQEACILTVSMHGGFERDLYLEDRTNPIDTPVQEGSFSFFDMRHHARLRPTSKADDVQFFLPWETINAVAEESGRPRMDHLRLDAGQVVDDPIMKRLADTLMPSFLRPQEASWLFIDQIMLAIATHVATTYGGAKQAFRPSRGGLAPWQERRAVELLADDISRTVSLEDLAESCGFSARHFARAFKQSTGLAPHQWLLERRIECARQLLRSSSLSLADIAGQCGFSGQSHFTRTFAQHTGATPGEWRRHYFSGDPSRLRTMEGDV